jgi:hypothetical protein
MNWLRIRSTQLGCLPEPLRELRNVLEFCLKSITVQPSRESADRDVSKGNVYVLA